MTLEAKARTFTAKAWTFKAKAKAWTFKAKDTKIGLEDPRGQALTSRTTSLLEPLCSYGSISHRLGATGEYICV
jgi:hypothetical protein